MLSGTGRTEPSVWRQLFEHFVAWQQIDGVAPLFIQFVVSVAYRTLLMIEGRLSPHGLFSPVAEGQGFEKRISAGTEVERIECPIR